MLNSPNKELIFTASVRGIYREQSFDEIAQFLKNRAGRVLIIALDQNQSAELLCRIAKKGLVYPAFTAILIDMPNILNLQKEVKCNKTTSPTKVWHGYIYLHVPIQTKPDVDTILVSNTTYGAYQKKLAKEFNKVERSYGTRKNIRSWVHWASVSHDEMWALTLAINNSFPILKSKTSPLTATLLKNMKLLQ